MYLEKFVIISVAFAITTLGFFYAFSLRNEFKSEGKILPEIQNGQNGIGQFAGLAALAGVDLPSGGNGDAIRPELYPELLKTTPFYLYLFEQKIHNKSNQILQFKDFYFNEILEGKKELDEQPLKYKGNNNYVVIDRQTENIFADLKKRIICNFDKKTGIILISVKMPDPVVAADIASICMAYLSNYIVNYRTEKISKNLEFLSQKLNAAKQKYYSNQTTKANYNDKLPIEALRSQSSDLQRERIESEYRVSSTFYNSLLQKYEEAKLKFQQETPIIKILEPPLVPNRKSEPKKIIYIMFFGVFGLFIGIIISVFKSKNYKLIFRNTL